MTGVLFSVGEPQLSCLLFHAIACLVYGIFSSISLQADILYFCNAMNDHVLIHLLKLGKYTPIRYILHLSVCNLSVASV